jgi:hypothetical protein
MSSSAAALSSDDMALGPANTSISTTRCQPFIAELRTVLYERLASLANRWNAAMGSEIRYPETHADFLQRCHNAGQVRLTPLLLQYGEGNYNCLHQDLYGDHVFPIQVAILLSKPSRDLKAANLF